MSAAWTWRDATDALARLRPRDRRMLRLVARLPLVWAQALQPFAGLDEPSGVYRSLARLQGRGLIRAEAVSWRPMRSPRFYRLTDLGLAVTALDHDVDVTALASRFRHRRSDLARLLVAFPVVLPLYELLGALAASRRGPVELLEWHRPWRERRAVTAGQRAMPLTLPAAAVLSWHGPPPVTGAYALVADTFDLPLARHRTALRSLTLLPRTGRRAPRLLIATTDTTRAAGWKDLLFAVGRTVHEAPPAATIVTWRQLRAGVRLPVDSDAAFLAREPGPLSPLRRRRAMGPVPHMVDPACDDLGSTASIPRRRTERSLRWSHGTLLHLAGRHPYLCVEEIATLLGWPVRRTRRCASELVDENFARWLAPGDLRNVPAVPQRLELTDTGVGVLAARLGLAPQTAIRLLDLAGGGPTRPFGPRPDLVRHPAHTVELHALVVRLCVTACRVQQSSDAPTVVWRRVGDGDPAPARPDAYLRFERQGLSVGFFLEYDRGTMATRDLRQKFAAYAAAYRRKARRGDDTPTILVVATEQTAEDRVIRAAREVAHTTGTRIPVLTTTMRLLASSGFSLLGPVWRDARAESLRGGGGAERRSGVSLGNAAGPGAQGP